MHYRPEIDGLRALAVIPVILFHAGFTTFSGGFVGVDVFFVISGYLITSIILAEISVGRFSLLNFYERRARRILPALFTVMLACLPFAWFWLPLSDFKSFSESLVAVSTFSSNILFWRTSGYFDVDTELKPLLHTWSLAVEEQYYLFFPIFIIITWKLNKRLVLPLLVVIAVISLTIAQFFVTSQPEATFYLLPARGWELLIGAFIAFYFSKLSISNHNQLTSQILSFLGLLLLIYAVFIFDKNTPFPSFHTLIPTIGTALIILFAAPKTYVGKLLSSKPFVIIGLISYSAYLWHHPLFAFARHQNLGEPNQLTMALLCITALVLAFFSWKYIEAPFRKKGNFSRKQIFLFGVLGSVFFISIGLAGHYTKGFEGRFTGERGEFIKYFDRSLPEWKYIMSEGLLEKNRAQCDFYNISKYREGYPTKKPIENISKECFSRNYNIKNSVFIWGDSHAQHLYSGLNKAMPNDWQILQVTSSGCEAKLGAKQSTENHCEQSNWFAYKNIIEIKPDVVLIAQDLNQNINTMKELEANFKSIGIKKIIFMGPTPHWKSDLPKIIVQKLWEKTPRRTFIKLDTEIIKLDKDLKNNFLKSRHSKFISIIDYFCNKDGCMTYVGDNLKEGITTYDHGHFSLKSSYYFAKDVLVKEIIEE